MKFRVTMKDPDVLQDGIDEALGQDLEGMPDEEAEALSVIRRDRALEIASEWFEYSEYLTVEIDTEKQTIRVVPTEDLG